MGLIKNELKAVNFGRGRKWLDSNKRYYLNMRGRFGEGVRGEKWIFKVTWNERTQSNCIIKKGKVDKITL